MKSKNQTVKKYRDIHDKYVSLSFKTGKTISNEALKVLDQQEYA